MKRNPTSVEAFDISQSNSEHSRHWFFKGRYVTWPFSHALAFPQSSWMIGALGLTDRLSRGALRLVIDGQEVEESLMDLVIRTLEANPNNSLIAFRYVSRDIL
jgi:phosphoribosylformylglycinamidine synthase